MADKSKNLIARQLIQLRIQSGLSQQQLAERLQGMGCYLTKNAILRIESDRRSAYDFEIAALCRLFHVSFEQLSGMEPLPGVQDNPQNRAKPIK